jgi:hypothetical protein
MLRPALLVATLLAAVLAFAADNAPDPHFTANRTSAIVHKSVFVHGYLHGYEQGFHLADLDIQLGRGARDIGKGKEARDADVYRREFGDKRFFERGYREGLRVGYADGMAGRAFRAFTELETIGAIAPQSADTAADPAFDQGFSLGYANGQHQGVQDGRRDASLTPPLPSCPVIAQASAERASFCVAYVGGYRVGYSDGFTNVARTATPRFEARAGK